ncbi:MAG: radical SAM protein [Candidatus Aenigmarchaeota archaeon]|nr:radical SAM protein [Candidatus Aenigmarchaeota archaeon]
MFNPVELAKETESIVCRNSDKKFYSFEPSKSYGGIATADCVGCCLRCAFCKSWKTVEKPEDCGEFCKPKDVADQLIKMARENSFKQVRLSGNEPTLGWQHLLKVLKYLKDSKLDVIIETNGIILGCDLSYARELAEFKDIVRVRVSIKGATPSEFSKLTGAEPRFFEYQIEALKNLKQAGVPAYPAVMVSFSNQDSLENLRNRLETIDPSFFDFEEEELEISEGVRERLEKVGVVFKKA